MGMAVDPGYACVNGRRKKPDGKAIRANARKGPADDQLIRNGLPW
jgi:hypothetical protein